MLKEIRRTLEDWLNWFDFEPAIPVEKKKKECYLYCSGRLAKISIEALKTGLLAYLKATVLELDGEPIRELEQRERSEVIERATGLINESDQRFLIMKLLANFGVRAGENVFVVSEDFARDYARFLRLQSTVMQKSEKKGE